MGFGAKEPRSLKFSQILVFTSRNLLAAKLVVAQVSDTKYKPFSPQAQNVSCEQGSVLITSTAFLLKCGVHVSLELTC